MIRTKHAHLKLAALTHAGMTGKNNEDRFAVSSFRRSSTDTTPILFAVVADGIGGHRAGEVAAELAVDHISEVVADSDGLDPLAVLEKAIHVASEAIADHAAAPEKQGMGATCACVWVAGDRLYTAWVGDTRIYLLREGRLQQLTVDHSWVQEAMERGILTPEQAREHPNVHVIRRYLGSPEPPEVDFRLRMQNHPGDTLLENNQGAQLLPGDTLLLCTDGLSDLVWSDEISEIIRSQKTLELAAQALIDTANERGGHDNITVLLLSAPGNSKSPVRGKTNLRPWILGGLAGILLLVAFAIVLIVNLLRETLSPSPTPTETSVATLTAGFAVTRRSTLSPSSSYTVTSPIISLPSSQFTYTPWPTNTQPGPSGTPVGSSDYYAFSR
jgi:PPM family protein phosphatase